MFAFGGILSFPPHTFQVVNPTRFIRGPLGTPWVAWQRVAEEQVCLVFTGIDASRPHRMKPVSASHATKLSFHIGVDAPLLSPRSKPWPPWL